MSELHDVKLVRPSTIGIAHYLAASVATIRDLLRRILSPRLFHFVRLRWWCLSFYFPRLVTSWFVKNTPEVRGFDGSCDESHLVEQLRTVNTLAPTKMCRVMTKYGSDKGHGSHNYTTVYSALFKGCHDRPLRIFELGLGTNNPGLASNVGVYGLPGASLRGWRELFPHALVYGADIDRDILFQEDRIRTFYCDQLDQAAIRQLWSQPDLQGGMDIIIEDGLHSIEASFSFLDGSLEQLRPGGVYVVEDVSQNLVDEWYDRLELIYSKRYSNYEFAFALLPNSTNPFYNNLLIIRRDGGDESRPVQVHELSDHQS
jgi:hypothetical protein